MAVTAIPIETVEYAADLFDDLLEAMFSDGVVTSGLFAGNYLAVTCGGTSPVSVNTGAARLNGKLVKNSASVDVAIATPAAATRIDRIIVKLTNATGVAEIIRLAGDEGGAAPDHTALQIDGTTWAISLAQVSITTGGAITLTKEALRSEPRGMFPVGTMRWWGGSLSGHYPLDPITSAPDTRWHLCNGDNEGGVVTPNVADKMLIAAGSTYSKGTAYGAAAIDLAHTHDPGTLAVPDHGDHRHSVSIETSDDDAYYDAKGTGVAAAVTTHPHQHTVTGNTGYVSPGTALAHGSVTGASDTALSATQSVLNPCVAEYLLYRVLEAA